jgi:hypothetical protein
LPGRAAPVKLHPLPLLAAIAMGACAWVMREHTAIVALAASSTLYAVIILAGDFFASAELKLLHLDRLFQAVTVSSKVR